MINEMLCIVIFSGGIKEKDTEELSFFIFFLLGCAEKLV